MVLGGRVVGVERGSVAGEKPGFLGEGNAGFFFGRAWGMQVWLRRQRADARLHLVGAGDECTRACALGAGGLTLDFGRWTLDHGCWTTDSVLG